MTTIEFVTKNLNKAKVTLEIQKQRKGVSAGEIARLEEKIRHWQDVLNAFRELEITRAFVCENGLALGLLNYANRKGFFE